MNFERQEYYDEVFENINIQDDLISSIEFDNCTFRSCTFNESKFEFCKLVECSFENCDLSLINVKGSIFNDVKISNSKAIGINWVLCGKPFDVNFDSSNISMSSFYHLDLRHTQIISCKAHDVDFGKTNLEKVSFQDTDLLGSMFGDTNLKETNLSQATNYMIDPNKNYIKGTKVSLPQATSFLKFFDLKII